MKRFLQVILVLIVVANVLIVVTGSTYVYRVLFYNFSNIDDYCINANRVVMAADSGKTIPWHNGNNYNKKPLNPEFESQLRDWNTVAFLIIKDDSVRTEYYWDGYADTSHSNSFSVAKSIVGTLIGIALKEGKIKSLDEPACNYIPEFKDAEHSKITIRHLMQMSSGLMWDESYNNPVSITAEAYYGKHLKELVTELPVAEEPGKHFNYQSCCTQLLALIVQKATGKKVSDYASEKLWKPMGAEHDAWWSLDHKQGLERAFCCFNSNARDFARLGKLYLNKGNFNGVQIVDSAFVDECTKPNPCPEVDGKPNKRYGMQWWCINRNSQDIFFARGLHGQYIFVIPQMKMIVVRLGEGKGKTTPDGHLTDIYAYLDEAMKMYP